MKHLFLLAVIFSSLAFAQEVSGPCFGPGGCGAVTPGTWAGPDPYPPPPANPNEPCFGPGGCGAVTPSPAVPDGPCLGDAGCTTREVRQEARRDGLYATVWLTLPNGYAQAGVAGPCWESSCPDLINQAETEAVQKLKNGLRYDRWPTR